MEDHLVNQVRHLREVEGLSIRQTADALGLSRKKTTRLIKEGGIVRKKRKRILEDYARWGDLFLYGLTALVIAGMAVALFRKLR